MLEKIYTKTMLRGYFVDDLIVRWGPREGGKVQICLDRLTRNTNQMQKWEPTCFTKKCSPFVCLTLSELNFIDSQQYHVNIVKIVVLHFYWYTLSKTH